MQTPARPHSLMNHLRESAQTMSRGHRAVARTILERYEEAAYLTASRLGLAAGVSESTVVRFAMELGFDGYPHFQRTLQEELKGRLTAVERMRASGHRRPPEDVLGAVLLADQEQLRRTQQTLDRSVFHQVVTTICSARKIYILGVRSAASLATFLGFNFNLIFDQVRLVHTTGVSDLFEQMLSVGPGDVVIGISFPRYSKRAIRAMAFARSSGATVVALTDSACSPVAQNADLALLAPSDMAAFADSLVAPLSVINALITEISSRKQVRVSERLELLERVWDEFDVYDKGGTSHD